MPSSNSGHTGTNTRHSGLHYVYPGGRDYQRIKKGENFEYLGLSGKALTNRRIIKRIESLKIPPAWEKVWICSDPGGHLQARGTDASGRFQYRYHPDWQQRCSSSVPTT